MTCCKDEKWPIIKSTLDGRIEPQTCNGINQLLICNCATIVCLKWIYNETSAVKLILQNGKLNRTKNFSAKHLQTSDLGRVAKRDTKKVNVSRIALIQFKIRRQSIDYRFFYCQTQIIVQQMTPNEGYVKDGRSRFVLNGGDCAAWSCLWHWLTKIATSTWQQSHFRSALKSGQNAIYGVI